MEQQFHFQDEEKLRTEHMTDAEAKAVVALWAEQQRELEREQARLAAMPTVHDVAEGLQIPADEARRLLHEVRARQEQALQTGQKHITTARSHTALYLSVALFLIFLLFWLVREVTPPPVAVESTGPSAVVIEGIPPPPVPPALPNLREVDRAIQQAEQARLRAEQAAKDARQRAMADHERAMQEMERTLREQRARSGPGR